MAVPRVTILCPELSTNALGRSLLLARLLPPESRPAIVGLHSLPSIWAPARNAGIPIHGIRVRTLRDLMRAGRWLRANVRGDLLLVSKALPTSLGLAHLARLRGVRMALDVDDWEVGMSLPHDGAPHGAFRQAGAAVYGALRRRQANSVLTTRACEALVRRVPERLVSNRWLERRFGGTLLYHVRDSTRLDPSRVDAAPLRESLGLDARPWIGFIGTVRPHKGLGDLVDALSLLSGPDAPGLLILGADAGDPVVGDVVAHARAQLGEARVRLRHQFPLDALPQHVQVADVIAVPSRDVPHSRGQMPAKIFDAMTMAKPIVATAVNDVPEVLGESGICVPPGDVAALAGALDRLRDPALRRELGRSARSRLESRYSFANGRRIVAEFAERAVS